MQRRRLRSVATALAPRPSPAAAPQIDTEGGTLANWDVELVPPPGGAGPHTNRATRRSDPSEVHESKLAIVEGVGHPPFCDQQRYTELRASTRGTLRPDDVVVSTYPKCGTTWSEQVVLLLQNGGDTSGLNPATKNSFHPEELPRGKIWMEAMIDQDTSSGRPAEGEFRPLPLSDFVALPSPRLIKTHAPVEMLLGGSDEPGAPPCGGAKTVYVSRNLKDACVSSYYHAFNPFESGWPFDAWAAAWLSGGSSFGRWCEVTRDWYALSQRWPEQILFVLFEDLKVDGAATIRRVAEHIGVEASPELIDKVIEGSSFSAMSSQAVANNDGEGVGHLRKGDVGDWRRHFSQALSAEFESHFREQMRGTGLRYDLGDGEELVAD